MNLGCIVLLVLASPVAALAATPVRPCALLTAAGVQSLVGGTVGQPVESVVSFRKGEAGNDHDGYVATCTWTAGGNKVMLTVGTSPVTPEGKARGEAHAKAAEKQLAGMGAKSSKKPIGGMECGTVVWPSSMAKLMGAAMTSCGGESGPLFFLLAVTATVAGDAVAPEKVAPIADDVKPKL